MCKRIMLERRLIVKLIQIQKNNLYIQKKYNTEEKFCIFEILHIGLFIQCDDNIRIIVDIILSTFP